MKLELFTTYGSGKWDEQFRQTVVFTEGETENHVVNLYPELTYQTLEGFGGAITDATASVYMQMPAAQKKELMETYFTPERMNYQMIRVPIDSCDFSREQYEAWTGDGELDFARIEQVILPMLRDGETVTGKKLPLMLSPWSPPAAMKTNSKREQGAKLKAECRAAYADYLCRYIEEYRKRGFPVSRLTLQNEAHAVQTWDSCIYTAAEEKEFLRDFMWPAMERYSLTDIEIFLWDHNKERVYEWMRDIIDTDTEKMIAGAAVHWYSGDHFEALDLCRERFPHKKLIVSESCIELYKYASDSQTDTALRFAHEIIGDLNHGVSLFTDWNLLLDENGGPNYAGNYCLAPFLYDTKKRKLQPQLLQQYMEHFSHYLPPGSVRIAHSSFTEKVDMTAWKRSDGVIVVILLNKDKDNLSICMRLGGKEANFVLYPASISTAVIK